MPQLKPPSRLYQAALQSVRESVLISCFLIQQRFGTYDEFNCQLATKELQHYLVENLPGHIIDVLCNTTYVDKNSFQNNLDFRILLSVYMHRNMQTFCPQIKVNLDDKFWQHKFQIMKRLVILDLNLICTDEILQVVGNNCKKLEFINIVSKTEKIICSFNALKVKYFVSDLGLQYISECPNLKVIIMPKVIRSQSSGFKITHDGIMYLLRSLPNLKLITYSDIGTVLKNNIDVESPLQLSLTSIIAYQCENLQTSLILQVCPHLTELHLDFSSYIKNPAIGSSVSEIMRVLATSDVKLTSISVHLFNFCDNFKLFLEKKGIYIVTISLSVDSGFKEIDVIYLGELCPRVEKVHLYTSNKFDYSPAYKISKIMFSELKFLIVEMFEQFNILALFLKNAACIKQIVLTNIINNNIMDKVINNMIILNSFLELEELHVGIKLSFNIIIKFILYCPVLKKVTIYENVYETVSEKMLCFENVYKINKDLKSKNINTEIIVVKCPLRYNTIPFIL